ncbi:Protein kinase rad3 [Colletotrichum orbiculare MAFF 240422]|uniref:non-specific serine/threonine protein kinase n=1 Tax=Colletotrichum orbiculare (strain 104-T / ATCC 96160 / CBS 514.97 / LARS 414 / MAFF 240422) TaxID=1213857 RepID=A0A484F9S9_COLOR|nr:Protein kinase rad3 [Colletotrichum orbiculare MAFF 240422]
MASNQLNGKPSGTAATAAPPSTLAAQLVENISASNKSTRSDENAELRRLFSTIEKIKNEPELLRTLEERTEHNHMLIYVYARVVLEGIKLDDPFPDRSHLRNEALKAINFLRITIEETPGVLLYCEDGNRYVFRGQEPLWVWIFPKILRLLGHSNCVELSTPIESFFQFLLVVTMRRGSFWSLLSSMLSYLRESSNVLISRLHDLAPRATGRDVLVDIALPPANVIELILGNRVSLTAKQTGYSVTNGSQAVRQATALISIVARLLQYSKSSQISHSLFVELRPWLLDSLLALRAVQNAWQSVAPSKKYDMLEFALHTLPKKPAASKKELVMWKAYTVLALLCSELSACPDEIAGCDDASHTARRTLCVALLRLAHASLVDREIGKLVGPKVVLSLELLCTEVPSLREAADFSRSIDVLKQVSEATVSPSLKAESQAALFMDPELRHLVQGLHIECTTNGIPEPLGPASKKRKVLVEAAACRTLMPEIHRIIGQADDTPSLEEKVCAAYPGLTEENQCLLFDLLSRNCCVVDQTTQQNTHLGNKEGQWSCTVCDQMGRAFEGAGPVEHASKRVTQRIFARLIHLDTFQQTKRPRIIAMMALRRIISHSTDAQILDLETSPVGQWCLQSVHSSLRELRIASGRTLTMFLMASNSGVTEANLLTRNRKNALSFLKTALEKNTVAFHETGVLAWSRIGRVVNGDELNLVLHQLLEYLGSSNSLVSSCAFSEILNLSAARKDVIQKIAEARGDEDNWAPIMDASNAGGIFALLLVQDVPDMERFVISRLTEFSSHFEAWGLADLIRSDVVNIVLELLKAAGDADVAHKDQIIHSINTVCVTIMAANKEARPKKGNTIGRFLQSYILGLMARLADVINDMPLLCPPPEEQRRCIRAMEEMIRLCKAYVRIARPQISACLLSAMAQDELREAAFSCWAALLKYLEAEDVEVLLETNFFVIDHYWPLFSAGTRATAKELVVTLLKQFNAVIVENIWKLPSLAHITDLADVEMQLRDLRQKQPIASRTTFAIFAERISHDNSGVVLQALSELVIHLKQSGGYLQTSAIGQQVDPVVSTLLRALLDCATKYNALQIDIASLCTQCIGLIGCLDSNRVEAVREQKMMVILNNFENADETTDFVLFILEEILVKAFLSTTDTKLQGFLSFAMQELLDRVDITAACAMQKTGMRDGATIYRKWLALPEGIREILTPFLTSRYLLMAVNVAPTEYPIFRPGKPYGNWMRSFSMDLLRKGQNGHADLVFEPLGRTIRVKDLTVAEFLLPYLVLHVIIGNRSTRKERDNVVGELVGILQHQPAEDAHYTEREDMKLFCEAVFRVLDYASRWLQEKAARRKSDSDLPAISRVSEALGVIPPMLISQRAMDCREYSRALFHLEQHTQEIETEKIEPKGRTVILEQLQDIYTQIDEPDGLEGISAHLHVLDINQQILSHKKTGKYTAAQTWYEIKLAEEPDNIDVQVDLLDCLKQSGQHDVLLNYVEGMRMDQATENKIIPFAVEAAWATRRWDTLSKYTSRFHGSPLEDFNVSVARLVSSLQQPDVVKDEFVQMLQSIREKIASAMTYSATSSLQACHDLRLRCHVLTDLEMIAGADFVDDDARQAVLATLDRRLEVLGAYVNDKQYLLGIRRAAMELSRPKFSDLDISSLWLSSARLARKANSMHQSFNAVLHASQLGDDAAVIENARLLWKDGHTRKAIQLMLAKWLDAAGQTNNVTLRSKYQQPPKTNSSWEKGHYYLGRHYKKQLETEKALKVDEQSDSFVQGEVARLVIENYLRSLNYGTKYLYQTLPRILTLWLELGAQVDKAPEGKVSLSRELHRRRTDQLNVLHAFLDKYIARLPAYMFYTALPQIVARIAHPNQHVFERLTRIVTKVVESHPRQALWGLFGIMTARQASERRVRGQHILQALRGISKKVEGGSFDLKQLLRMGEKLAEQLLLACNNGNFQSNRSTAASITRDLNFNHKCTPCPLVVPIESCLAATLPTLTDNVKKHKAFSQDVITIDSFLDDVLILGSLAKPRRLTCRGTDGKNYMLMIKPKDDLRTDQRLMEFNGMINRSLKRDPEASRRQLYIKTYAVVPLNEECGIIEWVDGLKTLREILLDQYKARSVHPDYNQIKRMMAEAVTGPNNIKLFTEGVLGTFPPVLQHWFIQRFPHPSTWFSARLKYTRSCAVMSMVGTILGLGDRHGENVLLERDNGGIFHVDFNCLFDKGLTFAQPERVPFRLTHNMVAAMGIYGYEGPFRHCSELTLGILRQQEETLMTILEAFIYDPTLDLQKEKKVSRRSDGAPRMQPQLVVDSIKRKVRGLMGPDPIPLGVEGQVEELIKQAVDPRNLAAMYIGWCPFL